MSSIRDIEYLQDFIDNLGDFFYGLSNCFRVYRILQRMNMPPSHAGLSRMFTRYRAEPDLDASLVLREDFRERDKESGRYFDKTVGTTIRLTKQCSPEAADRIARHACDVRQQLDADGVKLYFDRPKADPDNLYPKWKYRLNGQFQEIPIERGAVDPEILTMVRTNPNFFRENVYKKWYGRKMQHAREGIIVASLQQSYAGLVANQDAERIAKKESVEKQPVPTAPMLGVTPELSNGIAMLVDDFVHLYDLPAQTDKLVARVAQFSKGLFEYQFVASGAKPRPQLPPDALYSAVLHAIETKFADDAPMTAALRNLSLRQTA